MTYESDGRKYKIRTQAFREFETGTVFHESDGKFMVVKKTLLLNKTFEYMLMQLTDKEYDVQQVMMT